MFKWRECLGCSVVVFCIIPDWDYVLVFTYYGVYASCDRDLQLHAIYIAQDVLVKVVSQSCGTRNKIIP